MFGHHDTTQTDENPAPDAAGTVQGAAPTPTDDQSFQHPGQPIDGSAPEEEATGDVLSPAGGFPRSTSNQVMDADRYHAPAMAAIEPVDSGASTGSASDAISADDTSISSLINIKQMALSELLPLIDQLDQTPEERFRTVMMLIQASDNKDLVDKAYEAAHKIEDEKVRAQALLDIVNEINYFTNNS